MSRIPEIDPAPFSPVQHKLYDAMMASRPDGKHQGPSRMSIRNIGLAAMPGQMAARMSRPARFDFRAPPVAE